MAAAMNSADWLSALSLIISAGGIGITIWIWKSSIDKKLDRIIDDENALTYQQAEALVDVYMTWTRADLKNALNDFFLKDFDTRSRQALLNAADEFIHREAMEIIRDKRAKLQCFMLPNRESFMQFLDKHSPIESGGIAEAQKLVIKEIKSAIESQSEKEAARIKTFHIVQGASNSAYSNVINVLKVKYGK